MRPVAFGLTDLKVIYMTEPEPKPPEANPPEPNVDPLTALDAKVAALEQSNAKLAEQLANSHKVVTQVLESNRQLMAASVGGKVEVDPYADIKPETLAFAARLGLKKEDLLIEEKK